MIDALRQDIVFALRSLRRSRWYTITTVATLALGIAASVAVWSIIESVIVRPLPFEAPARLMSLDQRSSTNNRSGVSYPNFVDWASALAPRGIFTAMGYVRGYTARAAIGADLAPGVIGATSDDFWSTLRPAMALGRVYTADEARSGEHFAVLSYGAWHGAFHDDATVVGKTLTIDNRDSYVVVGVLARDAELPQWSGVYVPMSTVLATQPALTQRGLTADSRALARLAPGVSPARATSELTAVAQRLQTAYPENASWPAAGATPAAAELLGNAGSQLTILGITVVLVLLICWVNVTSLALVRATARVREFAIRAGLGASRGRLVVQILTETAIIALVSGVCALTAMFWAVGGVQALAGDLLPRTDAVHVDASAIGITLALTALSALVTGLVPAWHLRGAPLGSALRDGTAGAGTAAGPRRLRSVLVAGEVAFALMLVISAGLLVRTFRQLATTNPGFNTQGLIAVDFTPPEPFNDNAAQAAAYYARVRDATAAVPGITAAALTNHLPLNGASFPVTVAVAGRAPDPQRDPQVLFRTISPEYLATMQIPLRRGRNFTPGDLTGGNAVLVNEAFVRAFWADSTNPVGQSVLLHKSAQGRPDFDEPLPSVVVGVIGDVRHYGVSTPPVPEVYIPYTRNAWGHMVVVSRTTLPAASAIAAVKKRLLAVIPGVPLEGGVFGGFVDVTQLSDGSVAQSRLNMELLGGFGVLALVLATLGIYGLMTYVVSHRQRELGIRRALGAQSRDVVRVVGLSGVRVVGAGTLAGVAGALASTRLIRGVLFGVSAVDPLVFVSMTLLFALIALIACLLPAWRAARVDPMDALRAE